MQFSNLLISTKKSLTIIDDPQAPLPLNQSLVPLFDKLRQMPATLGRLAGDEMTACTVPGCTKSFKAKSINRHYVACLRLATERAIAFNND